MKTPLDAFHHIKDMSSHPALPLGVKMSITETNTALLFQKSYSKKILFFTWL